mmetsp:Transcript_33367/g.48975  ORF Transcript_33367/g.48975 Transcript_33367/m.48975 type:complete len:548 (-) Transcript_33367:164-1807(-)
MPNNFECLSSKKQREALERERLCLMAEQARILKERDEIVRNIGVHLDEIDAEISRLGGVPRSLLPPGTAITAVEAGKVIQVGGYASIRRKRGRSPSTLAKSTSIITTRDALGVQDRSVNEKKRGRPRKSSLVPHKMESTSPRAEVASVLSDMISKIATSSSFKFSPGVVGSLTQNRPTTNPKPKRGRPRKYPPRNTLPSSPNRNAAPFVCGQQNYQRQCQQGLQQSHILDANSSTMASMVKSQDTTGTMVVKAKRKRGRPRKYPPRELSASTSSIPSSTQYVNSTNDITTNEVDFSNNVEKNEKRKRGRPRKYPKKIITCAVSSAATIPIPSFTPKQQTSQHANIVSLAATNEFDFSSTVEQKKLNSDNHAVLGSSLVLGLTEAEPNNLPKAGIGKITTNTFDIADSLNSTRLEKSVVLSSKRKRDQGRAKKSLEQEHERGRPRKSLLENLTEISTLEEHLSLKKEELPIASITMESKTSQKNCLGQSYHHIQGMPVHFDSGISVSKTSAPKQPVLAIAKKIRGRPRKNPIAESIRIAREKTSEIAL